jgi:hypothetical protein
VPAVRHLHGLRSGSACSFCIDPTTVTADDLCSRMQLEPRGHGVGIAIGKQIDHLAGLKVTEDRAVAMTLAPCPVVNAKHARSTNRRLRPAVMKLPQ